MSNDDEEIWQAYTQKIKPVSKKKSVASSKRSLPVARKREKIEAAPNVEVVPSSTKISPMSFDRTTERKMRTGDIDLDARIDLHGMTQVEAHKALAQFIAKQVKAGRRKLLVITGKGKGNQGVLRTSLQGWLETLPDSANILGLRQAALCHGGEGAFYVFLKRRKG
jgi:DNA-nicking Smr family endonuclease